MGLRPEFASLLELIASREIPLASPAAAGAGPARAPGAARVGGRDAEAPATSRSSARARSRCCARCAHPRRLRWRPILHNVQTAGFEALPITGLLSFLMGVVIAYQGADQLQRFGANIFVVDLVALAMLRELSPLLTAIIVAGRSGSAYTAQIGTMKVTEEIDALRTIGVGAQELLVLPKVLALVIVLPLLTVYTDVTGVLGGMVMARAKLDVSFDVFVDRLDEAIAAVVVLDRHRQGAGVRDDHRAGRLLPRLPGDRQRRERRRADDDERRAVDLPRDRDRRDLLDRLPLARPVMDARPHPPPAAVIEVRGISTRFGDAVVHEDVSLAVHPGEIFALVGGSGSGKSTLLREIILLQQPVVGLDPRVRAGGRRALRRRGAAAAPALGRDVRARRAVQLAHGGRERRHGAARAHRPAASG